MFRQNFSKLAFLFTLFLFCLIAPHYVLADTVTDTHTFQALINLIILNILTPVVSFLVGIALVVFIWGVLRYIGKAGDEAEREKARQLIIWGIVGIFVMVSVWGLVGVLTGSFDWNTANPPTPQNTLSQ